MCGAKVWRCPVTSSTPISILRNRSLLSPWCRLAARSLAAPNHTARAAQGRAIVKHAGEQLELIDTLAERVQMLGGVAIADPRQVAEVTKIERAQRGRRSTGHAV